jgi:c-di-GMP-related signal transduction protein
MAEQVNRGFFEAQSRIVEEALGKPAFKDSLRLFLKNIDPENSPRLVRAVMGKDIEVPLALLSTLPSLANAFIHALDEIVVQVREKFSPPLLASFMESILDEIDKETLARVITNARALADDLSPSFREIIDVLEDKMKLNERGEQA